MAGRPHAQPRVRWAVVAAVMAALLVLGRGACGDEGSAPDGAEGSGPADEAADAGAADVAATFADASDPPAADSDEELDPCAALQVPTPWGAYAGAGHRWTRILGPSPKDPPGPAAVVAPPAAVAAPDIALGPPPTCGTDAPPAAVVLPGDADWEQVDSALSAGAYLVFLDGTPPPEVQDDLLTRAARRTCRDGARSLLAFATTLDSLPASPALLVATLAADTDPAALLFADRWLRARGRRLLLRVETPPSPGLLAAHFVLGGGLWTDRPLAPDLEEVVAFARAHRDSLSLPAATVSLRPAPARGPADAALLQRAHVPFDLPPDDPEVADERLAPYVRRLEGPLTQDPSAFSVAPPVLEDGSVGFPERVATSLPASVLVERRKLPARNAVVHHLVNLGSAPVAGWLDAPAWVLGDGGRCRATWFDPAHPDGLPLPCAPRDEVIPLDLPAVTTWGFVVTEPLLAAPSGEPGPVTLRPEDSMEGSMSVQAEVPGWPGSVEEVTLFVPEAVVSGDQHEPVGEGLVMDYEVGEEGRFVRGEGANGRFALVVELRGGAGTVEVAMTVTNVGDEPLEDISALVCMESKPAGAFPREGHGRTWTAGPRGPVPLSAFPVDARDPLFRELRAPRYGLTMLESIDGRHVMGSVFEGSTVAGGNGGRTHLCLHSRPRFGDLAPGLAVTRRGRLYIRQGSAAELQASYEADPLGAPPAGDPLPDTHYRLPCR